MTQLSSTDMAISRKRPQSTKLRLSIFQPPVVFKARVNDASIARGERAIKYDTPSVGLYTDVKPGMTMWVGSTNGKKDKGKIRVKDIDATYIYVAENDDIDWQNNQYLTVINHFEIWPIYPRIIQDPSDAEEVIFYKDYDIAYTNQNTVLGAFPCAGSHRAAYIEDGDTSVSLYFTAVGTRHVKGESLAYQWEFSGATTLSASVQTPGWIEFDTPGHYVQKLTVYGDSSEDVTYRYVSIYDKNHPPVGSWVMSSDLSGSRDEGGYTASITVYENIEVDEGDVIVLFSDDWYGNSHVSIGGNGVGNSKTFFVGYILKGSIKQNYRESSVTFDVGSVTEVMKLNQGFSISVESAVTPSKWFQIEDMDGERALYHYLRWHSTVLNVTDIRSLDNLQRIQYFDADRTSLYDAVDNFVRSTYRGKFVSDMQGKVWIEFDADSVSNPTGTYEPIMYITKQDWANEPSIEENLSNVVSYMEMGGVFYPGPSFPSGSTAVLLACAPGETPSTKGTVEIIEGLALSNQANLNKMVGNVFANMNTRYPTIDMQFSNNYRQFDIAPQETIQVQIAPQDTVRGITLDAPYLIDGLNWTYDAERQMLSVNGSLTALVNGMDGSTIVVPDLPDVGTNNNPNVNNPKIPGYPSFPTGTYGSLSSWMGHTSQIVTSTITPIGNFTFDYGNPSLAYNSPNPPYSLVLGQGVYLVLVYIATFPDPVADYLSLEVYSVPYQSISTVFEYTGGENSAGRLNVSTLAPMPETGGELSISVRKAVANTADIYVRIVKVS